MTLNGEQSRSKLTQLGNLSTLSCMYKLLRYIIQLCTTLWLFANNVRVLHCQLMRRQCEFKRVHNSWSEEV